MQRINHKRTQKKSEPQMGLESTTPYIVEANNHLTLASLHINFCHAYAKPLCHDTRIKCSVAFSLVNDPAYTVIFREL